MANNWQEPCSVELKTHKKIRTDVKKCSKDQQRLIIIRKQLEDECKDSLIIRIPRKILTSSVFAQTVEG